MVADLDHDRDDFGVLVINAWRESAGRPLVLRITTSRGDAAEAVVTVSADEVEGIIRRWLAQFEGEAS